MPVKTQESPTIVASKKYAKHLSNLLKPHVELSHTECLNIVARMQGAKNWNTYHSCNGYGFGSNFVPTESNHMVAFDGLPVFGYLNSLLRKTILPTIRDLAKANALEVLPFISDGEEYGFPKITLIHGAHVPAIEYDVFIEPLGGMGKGYCSFHGDLVLSRHSVAIRTSNLYLGFPAVAADVAFRIARDKRMDTGDVINIEVAEPDSDSPFPILINLQGFFGPWSGSARTRLGDLTADTEEMRLTWKDLAQMLSQMARIFKAYYNYAGKWNNKAAVTKFLENMGEILSGEPRYRQVPRCFYETTIRKKTFRLAVYDSGPYLICGQEGVELDRGEVIRVDEDFVDHHRKVRSTGYHIAKYGNPFEIRISLEGFGPLDFRRLSKEVGARLFMQGTHAYDFHDFHKSKAFDGLKKWMIENPRFARELVGKHEWYDAALEHLAAK